MGGGLGGHAVGGRGDGNGVGALDGFGLRVGKAVGGGLVGHAEGARDGRRVGNFVGAREGKLVGVGAPQTTRSLKATPPSLFGQLRSGKRKTHARTNNKAARNL